MASWADSPEDRYMDYQCFYKVMEGVWWDPEHLRWGRGGERGRGGGLVCRGHVSTRGSLWAQRQWPVSEHWLVVPAGLVTGSKGWPATWSVVTKTSSCCAVFTDVTSLPCVTPRSSCAGPRGKPGNTGPSCALSHGPGRDWVALPGYSANPREAQGGGQGGRRLSTAFTVREQEQCGEAAFLLLWIQCRSGRVWEEETRSLGPWKGV